ncbi:MAG TPA: pyridoxal-dependent decarboxylase, partial [Bacillota bacterium]|nr:pyridoxal-dependent decarboxylase [Bacillota bacterium]
KELFHLAKEFGIDYLEKAFDRNVYPEKEALARLAVFDEELPDHFTPALEVLNQLNGDGSPATVAQVGGRYFGFVNGSVVPAGLAARLLSDFWDQNTAMQVISPISARLETVVQKWLRQIFHLPDNTVAGFVSGTSMATFCGLAAARYRILKKNGWDVNEKGLFGAPKIRVVAGKQAHSTVLKAIGLLGFGKDNVEWIDTDAQGRIMVEKLPPFDDHTIVILQAGNVNTGAYDYFSIICDKANTANAWVHIDGAFGLWAGAVKELQHLTIGMEKADSWSVDGHKTLNTPYDNGIVLCRDEEALVSALHMTGSYIVLGEERDGMFYTPEMSRRARIIELWATLRSLGKNGINEMVYGLHQRAKQFAAELAAAGFEILNDVCFNQVLVHYQNNEMTLKILKKIQEMRVCWCGGSKWNGKEVIRVSVCSWATTARDVSISVASFIKSREMVENE